MKYLYFDDVFCTVTRPGSPESSIIILPDFPDMNTYTTMMHWLNRRGHATFHPRYKGSMQSHGAFLSDHPGETMATLTGELPTEETVLIGIGFGSLVALSVATRCDVNGLILVDPWWDIDLLDDTEEYFKTAFQHHHYLYRDERDNLPRILRRFEDLYPFGYADHVEEPAMCFIPNEPSVPRGATEEMAAFIDIRVVEYSAASVEQCFVQNIDRVYSFLNEVTL